MKKGSVAVDVAVDQGGCFETTQATTHSDPVYTVDGVIHYCVANMPGAVARTSTFALTNSTLRYALELANKGLKRAVTENPHLAEGVNTHNGKLTYRAVAEAQGRPYTAPVRGAGRCALARKTAGGACRRVTPFAASEVRSGDGRRGLSPATPFAASGRTFRRANREQPVRPCWRNGGLRRRHPPACTSLTGRGHRGASRAPSGPSPLLPRPGRGERDGVRA